MKVDVDMVTQLCCEFWAKFDHSMSYWKNDGLNVLTFVLRGCPGVCISEVRFPPSAAMCSDTKKFYFRGKYLKVLSKKRKKKFWLKLTKFLWILSLKCLKAAFLLACRVAILDFPLYNFLGGMVYFCTLLIAVLISLGISWGVIWLTRTSEWVITNQNGSNP